jgi:hypothetical protein
MIFTAGEQTIRWDCRDDAGRTLPAGACLVRVQTMERVMVGRIMKAGPGD